MPGETETLHDLLFGIRRSIRYHLRRRAWFESLDTLANAVAVILGSATVAGALAQYDKQLVALAGVLVTVTASMNLVVGCGNKARAHSDLARRFIALEREIELSDTTSAEHLKRWKGERLSIESDEPPSLKVLDALCYNEVMRSMGYPKSQYIPVRWWQRWCAQLVDLAQEELAPAEPQETATP